MGGATPEGATPEGATPEGVTPEGGNPEVVTPEGSNPEEVTSRRITLWLRSCSACTVNPARILLFPNMLQELYFFPKLQAFIQVGAILPCRNHLVSSGKWVAM